MTYLEFFYEVSDLVEKAFPNMYHKDTLVMQLMILGMTTQNATAIQIKRRKERFVENLSKDGIDNLAIIKALNLYEENRLPDEQETN